VADLETLEPTDIEGMTTGDWDLTLFTCTYGNRYRLAVRCFLTD
jgi:sortase A